MDNHTAPDSANRQRCPRCQSPLTTVVVHGHEQCLICKSNIFECCSGETCDTGLNSSLERFLLILNRWGIPTGAIL